MICKYCKKEIENDSIFCRFCGEKLIRARKKPKDQISVPAPVQTPEGKYRGRLMVKGQRVYVTEDTEAAYYIRARAVKAGLIEQAAAAKKTTLHNLIDRYIQDNTAVFSPSTVFGYQFIQNNCFAMYMQQDVSGINWQRMISDETDLHAPKTVKNAWRLVTASLKYSKLPVPTVNLPKSVRNERAFLDFAQIQTFIKGIKDNPCELEMLLALHSLRLSEIAALQADSFVNGSILVRGARVYSGSGYVTKPLNKTDLSRRDVPIMIPRLNELLPVSSFPTQHKDSTINSHIKQVCVQNKLPVCTLHCLRHSFASLAYHLKWSEKSTMQIGGWSTPDVVHRIYTHLAQQDVNEDVERMRAFYTQG